MPYDYDLIVIGGGSAGLTASGIGATLGAKTLMIEQARLGGDCTWTGCIPSKTLLKAAKVAWQARHASRYGLTDHPLTIDAPALMRHVRAVRGHVYEDADTPERYEALGVEVRTARARFLNPHTLEVRQEGRADRVTGSYIIIATGARASSPPLDGLQDVPWLTNETLFELEELPRSVAIIGAGPVGTEMAQALNRLGVSVTVIHHEDRIQPKDDPELAALLRERLVQEGVRYVDRATVRQVRRAPEGVAVEVRQPEGNRVVTAAALLVATGRRPNVEDLGLEAAGIAFTDQGIKVDGRCRTNVKHIFAAGDVTGRYQFTHMSEHMAKVAATNALLKWPARIDAVHVPWATYTNPELAQVGATEAALKQTGVSYEVYRFPFAKIDRAVTDGETVGLIKVFAKKWNGKILGAAILGEHAGDLIGELALAMRNGVTLRQISDTIHPYPTLGLGVRRAADQWYVRNYAPAYVRMLQKVFRYRGPIPNPDPNRIV